MHRKRHETSLASFQTAIPLSQHEALRQLLRKYLHNQCTPEELAEVKRMLREGKHLPLWNQVIEEDALQESAEEIVPDLSRRNRVYEQIHSTIHRNQPTAKSTVGQVIAFPRWLRVAAMFALLIVASAVAYFFFVVYEAPLQYATVVTQAGQRQNVSLADGSQVMLNTASSLRKPTHFARHKREVYLDGQAFFQVARDEEKPFIVHSGQVAVEVLGTSFDVQAFDEDDNIIVSVATGKVKVTAQEESSAGENKVILTPNQQAVVNKTTGQVVVKAVAARDVLAWQQSTLLFKNAPLGEVIKYLEKLYGVRIKVTDAALAERTVTLKQKESNLESTLQVLSVIAGVRYQRRGGEVILQPKTERR